MMVDTCGLYVHLPWCVKKCPYCDFNSYALDGPPSERAYVDALLKDLDHDIADGAVPQVASIFIGGGTPSLFSGGAIDRLLEGIAHRVALAADAEITLEANPSSAEAARFAAYAAAGVNRLSIGVQSFADRSLAALGRAHDAAAARQAIRAAQDAGFSNFNLDLMFGLPGQDATAALADLEEALAFSPSHLSWYQLTLEPGTAFFRRPPDLPEHDDIADAFDAGLERIAAAGFTHYEVSAHARPGRACRHNLNYWHFGDYIGIGAGAHGKLRHGGETRRRQRIRQPARYLSTVQAGATAFSESVVVGDDLVTEYTMNALRLAEGFLLEDFVARTGLDEACLAGAIEQGEARGWLRRQGSRVCATALGFRFLNDLQLLFVSEVAA